jgi:hypothetical protein
MLNRLKYKLYYSTIFQVKVWTTRRLMRILKVFRPTNYPFVTGDSFRSLAQHVFDDLYDFNPQKVSFGDIVFVRGDMLHIFFKRINPDINKKYILISHNADKNISREYDKYNKDNIIHWFAQNLLYHNESVSPIPIGLANFHYLKKNYLNEIGIDHTLKIKKGNKILISFDIRTNPARKGVRDEIIDLDVVTEVVGEERSSHYKTVSRFKFVASPEGNGIDCHRTWEAMYLGSIPIVKRNVSSIYFEKIGLPILLIDSWDEIREMSEEFLEKKYEELKPRFMSPALYIDYWSDLIIGRVNK